MDEETKTTKKAAASAAMKALWKDPGFAAKRSADISANMKRLWADPEVAGKWRAAILAGKAAKKREREKGG